MKKLVINCNDCFALYNFRLELLIELRKRYDLIIVASRDEYYNLLVEQGFSIIESKVEGSKKSIINDIKLYYFYKKLFKKIKPDIIINYTIKPHIYGTLACKNAKVINFISGVGSVFLNRNLTLFISKLMYKFIRKRVDLYIFLNREDLNLFKKYKFIKNKYKIIKGEGVVLEKFYPFVDFTLPITFIFIGRLVLEKGIMEYLKAAEIIKMNYPQTRFLVVGSFYDKASMIDQELFSSYEQKGIIKYLGYSFEVNEILKETHVVVLPSYREGLPISLVEALASKKILIASNVAGCRDVCINNYNGYLVKDKSVDSLVIGMEKYINNKNKILMHENALASSKQYAKEFYVEAMVDLLEKI